MSVTQAALKSRVVNLYKTLIFMGREYPSNPDAFCQKVHNAFMKNRLENDPQKIQDLISKGDYIVKELEALYMLRKYRTLKRRYYEEEDELGKQFKNFDQKYVSQEK